MMDSVNKTKEHKKAAGIIIMCAILSALIFIGLSAGSSDMTAAEFIAALKRTGSASDIRIIWNIRVPRLLAAVIAGAGLSCAGLIMQTGLHNQMASPSTLGVTNAAVFGANLSIIAFAGGYLATGNNLSAYSSGANPFNTSLVAFIFAVLSIMLILGLCRVRSFSPNVVVLAGIAVGAVWTAATSILQFYATDVGLSAAVIWNFGDLGRATYRTDLIMLIIVCAGIVFFRILSWYFNALLSGDTAAKGLGINVGLLRFVSLLIASVITAVCVSFLGSIGFIGIICPHAAKKLFGQDHRFSVPASALTGSILLIAADTVSRCIGNGAALPVGAITSLLGAPFFIALIFSKKGGA